MHEMALAASIREIVEDAARAHGAGQVRVVRLRIGALAAVEPQALRFCFDVVMKGGAAEAARLEIDIVPGSGWCWDCERAVTIAASGAACPGCGNYRLQVTGGTELRVHELDLDVAQEIAPCA